MEQTFTCEDCGQKLPVTKKCHSDYDICNECLENYEDKTGHCSIYCRINERCDESC